MDHAGNQTMVGWVPEPGARGTASLVFSCISTIVLCISNAVHLDVTFRQRTKIEIATRRLKFLVTALIAPELFSVVACREWNQARRISRTIVAKNWTTGLSLFVQMGGVLIQDNSGSTIRLPPDKVQEFFDKGWIDPKQLTSATVEDKSKASWIGKAVAAMQIVWFLSQSIGRVTSHLSISTLELFTLAYVACALFMYAFWWHKPFDVSMPLTLTAGDTFTVVERERIIKESEFDRTEIEGRGNFALVGSKSAVPFIVVCSALFSLCHLLGWNATFPTPVERLLWRIASVMCFAVPVLFLLATFYYLDRDDSIWDSILLFLLGPLYCLVRFFIMFEVFFALRKVPADMYITPRWSQILPHL